MHIGLFLLLKTKDIRYKKPTVYPNTFYHNYVGVVYLKYYLVSIMYKTEIGCNPRLLVNRTDILSINFWHYWDI